MSAVYALLSFLVAVGAVIGGYWFWEKRSTAPKSDSPGLPDASGQASASQVSVDASTPETVAPAPTPAAAIAQPEPPPTPAPDPAPPAPEISAPAALTIPDPWLEESPREIADLPMELPPELDLSPAEPVASSQSDWIEPTTSVSQVDISAPTTQLGENPSPDSAVPAVGADLENQGSGDGGQSASANLSERILRVGRSGQINQAAALTRYANHPSSQVRAAVARALGNLAVHWRGTAVEGMIPVLGKLSQDRQPEVRLTAVEALSKIRSAKVLPLLQRLQTYGDANLRKAATIALQRLKLNYQPKPNVLRSKKK